MEDLNAHLASVGLGEQEEQKRHEDRQRQLQGQEQNIASKRPQEDASLRTTAAPSTMAALRTTAARQVVIRYLEDYWAHSAAARALIVEMKKDDNQSVDGLPDLQTLLAKADLPDSNTPPQETASVPAAPSVDLPILTGPLTVPHYIEATHSSLHTNNILVVRSMKLPRRHFITSPTVLAGRDPHFATLYQDVLVSTSSDKQVLFFDPDTGDVIESLDPVLHALDKGHTSPVMDVAQHPVHAREFVTVGMDGKVVLWDVLKGNKVVWEARDHNRFIVKCVWDHKGEYLATAGYDKRLVVYKRRSNSNDQVNHGGDEEEVEVSELTTNLDLVHKVDTITNPESIHFITSPTDQSTWLVYSLRDDNFIHYLNLSSGSDTPIRESYNTNEKSFDTHRSYSILSINSHPTLPDTLSLVTGAHNSTSSTTQLILLPYFSSQRLHTIHTSVPTSTHYTPRQRWLPNGTGVYLTSEEGWLYLYDMQGKERTKIGVHGIVAFEGEREMSSEEKAKRWRMGGMNGSIRDLDLCHDKVVTCGFDRTVRIVGRFDTAR
ncbi:unnamed protein product [Sympodiomycopsis kandeliae]